MSSISGIRENRRPREASRVTNIAWSPVAMPVRRERGFISARDERRAADAAPSIAHVEAAPRGRSREASSISRSASGGSRVSACRNSNTSPFASGRARIHLRARGRAAPRSRGRQGRAPARPCRRCCRHRQRSPRRRARATARARSSAAAMPAASFEHRDDDGKRRHSAARHSAASFSAPPQLEPWPAVQPKQWPATRIGLPATSSSSKSERCTRAGAAAAAAGRASG